MASVVKTSREVHSVTQSIEAFNAQDLRGQASDVLRSAQSKAQAIVAQALAEAEGIRREAREKGEAEARSAIDREAEERAQVLSEEVCSGYLKSCEAVAEAYGIENSRWLAQWRDQTISLATALAEKILHRECRDRSSELLATWLTEAIQLSAQDSSIRLEVHPDDMHSATELIARMNRVNPTMKTVQLVPNSELQRSACVAHTDHGSIDQRLEVQLARLSEQLQEP